MIPLFKPVAADAEAGTRQETGRPARLANPPSFTHNSPINASGGFMLFRSGSFCVGVMLAMALLIGPAASQNYTPEQQQACTGDAFRLCNAEIPDVDRVTVCMIRNKSQLSPGCRAFFRPDPEPELAPVAARKPLSIKPASSRKPAKPKKKKPAA
jgi:hypothetical protein